MFNPLICKLYKDKVSAIQCNEYAFSPPVSSPIDTHMIDNIDIFVLQEACCCYAGLRGRGRQRP